MFLIRPSPSHERTLAQTKVMGTSKGFAESCRSNGREQGPEPIREGTGGIDIGFSGLSSTRRFALRRSCRCIQCRDRNPARCRVWRGIPLRPSRLLGRHSRTLAQASGHTSEGWIFGEISTKPKAFRGLTDASYRRLMRRWGQKKGGETPEARPSD